MKLNPRRFFMSKTGDKSVRPVGAFDGGMLKISTKLATEIGQAINRAISKADKDHDARLLVVPLAVNMAWIVSACSDGGKASIDELLDAFSSITRGIIYKAYGDGDKK